MKGQQFGRWTVIGPYEKTKKGEKKWLCRCACGTERHVLERSLKAGGSLSCGCQREIERKASQQQAFVGKVFGELTVLRLSETPRRGLWVTCRCSCGGEYECLATLLTTGRRTHCGSSVHRTARKHVDITGQRFQRLTALYPTDMRDKKGSIVWHCRCDCGNEVDIAYNNLMYTELVSCGCRKKEHSNTLSEHLTRVADTSINSLRSTKLPQNNTTGHKGVYWIRGKYVAKINFQKKAYYLGAYDTMEHAGKARESAQMQLFDNVADFYQRWQLRAETDPQWAKENPVQIFVEHREGADFQVTLLPVL